MPGATFRGDIAAVDALTGAAHLGVVLAAGQRRRSPAATRARRCSRRRPSTSRTASSTARSATSTPSRASVAACNHAAPNGFFSESCEQPGAFWDSIVAFNLDDGRAGLVVPRRRRRAVAPRLRRAAGAWCLPERHPGRAADGQSTGFGDAWDVGGSSPNVFQLGSARGRRLRRQDRRLLPVRRADGRICIWNTLVGPGGDQGGFEWGTALRRQPHLRLAHEPAPHPLPADRERRRSRTRPPPAARGRRSTRRPARSSGRPPTRRPRPCRLRPAPSGCGTSARSTVANGVVYVASMAKSGHRDVRARRGDREHPLVVLGGQLRQRRRRRSSNGSVYWGSGYSRSAEGSGNNKLYAFSIGGVVDTTAPGDDDRASARARRTARTAGTRARSDVSVSATDNRRRRRRLPDPLRRRPGERRPRASTPCPPPARPPRSAPTGRTRCTRRARTGTTTSRARPSRRRSRSTRRRRRSPPRRPLPPNANGWYSGDVVVHFTCTDAGSGIPAGACPPDQTLTGIGEAISSTSETVTDGPATRARRATSSR